MTVDRYQTSSSYVHPQDSNLLNLHKAMQYNSTGQPVVRVLVGAEGITFTGEVTIPGKIEVYNTASDPLHTHLLEMGDVVLTDFMPVRGTVTATQGTTPWVITGTVGLDAFSLNSLKTVNVQNNVTATVTGTVSVNNFPTNFTVLQGTNPWRVAATGTVNIGTMPEVEIKNDVGSPVPVSKNTVTNSATNPIFVEGVNNASFFSPSQSDAFGRLRVSNPFTLFDSFHRYQDNGKISQYVTGTNSTSSHSLAEGCVILSIGTGTNAAVYRESSRTFAYQPGKSLLVLQTFVMGTAKPNLRMRYGYYDTSNGHYLERDGDAIYFVRRTTSRTGSVTEERIAKDNWNLDKLDGTGTSKYTLNLATAQIFFTQIEWLGVGSVVQGFIINGEFAPCHRWDWANQTGSTSTYMATACLPIRAEIENTATTTSTSELKVVCTTVISEGGYELRGRARSVGHSIGAPYNLVSKEVVYPIFSMRLKRNRLGGIVLPKTFTIGIDKAANYRYTLVQGGITSGGRWIDAGASDSSVEYNLTATNIVNGNIVEIGYINASNQASVSPSLATFPFQNQLERNTFLNTGTEFTICIETDSANGPNAWCSINWEEIT